MNEQQLLNLGATMLALLLAGNAYFIKRLIDKLESTATTANAANAGVSSIGNLLREIKADIKGLRDIEIQVAVLKAQFGERKPAKKRKDDAEESCEPS